MSPTAMMALALLAVSLSPIFIRKADAHPLFVAFGRCAISSAVLLPFATRRLASELRAIPPASRVYAVLAGVFLGCHFAAWVASLSFGSIASCIVLVNTTPIWAGLLTPLLSRDTIHGRVRVGILVSFVGVAIIELPEILEHGAPGKGDLLALAGAVFAALYLLCGRRARGDFSIAGYLLLCYSVAAVALFVAVLAAGVPLTGWSSETLVWIALLGLVSQLVGHSTFNWALRWISAAVVSLALLVEPVLGTLWGSLFLDEPVPPAAALGGVVVLSGVWYATRTRS